MTLAIVLAAGAAGGTDHAGESMAGQWRRAGVADVRIATDLSELAALVAAAAGPVLVSATDLVAHTAVLKHLATSPVGPTVALVLTDPPAAGQVAVREERGQVVAVGAPGELADATGVFGGALRVGADDLPALAAAARAPRPPRAPRRRPALAAADPAVAGGGSRAVATASAVDRLFADLAARGTLAFAHRVRLLVAHRVVDPAGRAAAEAAVAAVDEDKAELRLSVKERDDFFTTFFVSTWSPYVTKAAARIGLGPTAVTMISVVFAVAAAVLFGVGGRPALVAGAVLLYLGFVLDCVDGQLARYTRHFSAWGGWLDTMADRAKEYVVYAGLGYGATHAGFRYGWALAIAAMTLQTVRHMTDTWYGVLHDEAARRPRPATGDAGGIGGKLNAASTKVQADTGSASYWLKRTVVFPIGERWALMALTAALFGPLVALCTVLVWAALAFAYTGALRTLRARWMRVPVLTTVDATLHRDDGPLTRIMPASRGRWRWRCSARRARWCCCCGRCGGPRRAPAARRGGDRGAGGAVARCAGCAGGARRAVGLAGAGRVAGRGVSLRDRRRGGGPRAGVADLRVRLRAHPAPLRPDRAAGEAAGGAAAARRHAGLGGALGAAGRRVNRRNCEYRSGYTRYVPSRGFRRECGPRLGDPAGPRPTDAGTGGRRWPLAGLTEGQAG